jgi:hypothetical protein
VHLESRVPTEMGEDASIYHTTYERGLESISGSVAMGTSQSREFKEMRTIHSLTSEMTRRQINAIRGDEAQGGRLGED